MLVFMMVFTTPVISQMKFIGGGWAVSRGWESEGGQNHACTRRQTAMLCRCSQPGTVGKDGRLQQFDTPSSLISVHEWPHRLCNGPLWFYMVGKRPPVKADLAIYSLIVGMSGQWENAATMLNIKLHFYTVVTSRSVFANPVIVIFAAL